MRAYRTGHDEAERAVIASGPCSQQLLQKVAELAPTSRSVLICGETGTGKTVLAQVLHAQSARPYLPLRLLNCAALSDALLADLMGELDDEAAQQPADDGRSTVLLDEIGELSPWGQAVLLRKLQHDALHAKVRFIAATHRDLDAMIAAGSFSRELSWRLNMARLALLPLRARRDEIVPLALHFLRLGLRSASLPFISLDPPLLDCLESYDWPGNVRELKNAMIGALAVNDSGMLGLLDLPDALRSRVAQQALREPS